MKSSSPLPAPVYSLINKENLLPRTRGRVVSFTSQTAKGLSLTPPRSLRTTYYLTSKKGTWSNGWERRVHCTFYVRGGSPFIRTVMSHQSLNKPCESPSTEGLLFTRPKVIPLMVRLGVPDLWMRRTMLCNLFTVWTRLNNSLFFFFDK